MLEKRFIAIMKSHYRMPRWFFTVVEANNPSFRSFRGLLAGAKKPVPQTVSEAER